jgi:hypothetical protein
MCSEIKKKKKTGNNMFQVTFLIKKTNFSLIIKPLEQFAPEGQYPVYNQVEHRAKCGSKHDVLHI